MLIDTNVWSEVAKRKPDQRVDDFMIENEANCFLSTIVVAEIEFGIAKATDPAHRRRLSDSLNDIITRCEDRILVPGFEAAAIWGKLKAMLEGRGEPIADIDLLIAAQAIAADMPLVTRNLSDMERTGAVIIDPWTA